MVAAVLLGVPLVLLSHLAVHRVPFPDSATGDSGYHPPRPWPTGETDDATEEHIRRGFTSRAFWEALVANKYTAGRVAQIPHIWNQTNTMGLPLQDETFPQASETAEDDGGFAGRPGTVNVETLLDRMLSYGLMDASRFHDHRRLAEAFITNATENLRRHSPMFTNSSLLFGGSSYEGTRVGIGTDFDSFILLDPKILHSFRIIKGERGQYQVRLRRHADRRALYRQYPELRRLVDKDGRLNAVKFKRWMMDLLELALHVTASRHPELHPVVYHTRGACGVNLTTAQGDMVELDFDAMLTVLGGRFFRDASVRPCGIDIRNFPAHQRTADDINISSRHGGSLVWSLYSDYDISEQVATDDGGEQWFTGNEQLLEKRLLVTVPALRHIIILVKMIRNHQLWQERYHLESFVIKHTTFWSFSENCHLFISPPDQPTRPLLPSLIASLRMLAQGVRAGQMTEFFLETPGPNLLKKLTGGPASALQFANEIDDVIRKLQSGRESIVRSVFGM